TQRKIFRAFAMANKFALLQDGRNVEYRPDRIGSGGVKDVYLAVDGESAVCLYRDADADREFVRRRRLQAILGRFNLTVPLNTGGAAIDTADAEQNRACYCWPIGLVL